MITWKPVLRFEGLYEASDDGQVRRLSGTCSNGRRWKGRVLKQVLSGRGYFSIKLCKNGKIITQSVHKTVLEAFVGPKTNGMHACHRNGDSTDNRVDNLRWDTPLGNAADKKRHGTIAVRERAGGAKITSADVLAIREMEHSGLSQLQIGELFGIGRSQVGRILKQQTWKSLNGQTTA